MIYVEGNLFGACVEVKPNGKPKGKTAENQKPQNNGEIKVKTSE